MFLEKFFRFFCCFSLIVSLQLGFLAVSADAETQHKTISVKGVVLVTTKSGAKQPARVSANAYIQVVNTDTS